MYLNELGVSHEKINQCLTDIKANVEPVFLEFNQY